MRPLRPLLLLALLGCGSSSAPAASAGPDAGAGCDSSIHAHCVYASGAVAPGSYGTICVEYSGASPDHSACAPMNNLQPAGQYAPGPCSRSDYDISCAEADRPAADAGTCQAFQTLWGHSSQWPSNGQIPPGGAEIPGYPACLNR